MQLRLQHGSWRCSVDLDRGYTRTSILQEVAAAAAAAPEVTITDPATGSSYAGQFDITASVTSEDTVASVSFYYYATGQTSADAVLIETLTSSPYTTSAFAFDGSFGVTPYYFYAVATNSEGTSGTSDTITVTRLVP